MQTKDPQDADKAYAFTLSTHSAQDTCTSRAFSINGVKHPAVSISVSFRQYIRITVDSDASCNVINRC